MHPKISGELPVGVASEKVKISEAKKEVKLQLIFTGEFFLTIL